MTGSRGRAERGGRRLGSAAAAGLVALSVLAGCARRAPVSTAAPAPRPTVGDSVNVGFGRLDPRAVSSAVGSVVNEDRADQRAATRIEQLLLRIPGVVLTSEADGGFTVRIRGERLRGGDPLWVIDGVPIAGSARAVVAGLVPSDVARIDVLKDAGAAVYGAQGANGVILVQTRRRR